MTKLIEIKPNFFINLKSINSIEVKKTEYKPERDMVVVRFGHSDECLMYFPDLKSAQEKAQKLAVLVSCGDIDEV